MTMKDMNNSPLTPELAARLHRALTADNEELFLLVQDPAADVLRAILRNRNLNQEHLLALLKRRDLPADLLKTICQFKATATSHQLKVALARHHQTPAAIMQALLPQLYLFELLDICLLAGPSPDQKLAAERAIAQRLPTTPLGSKLTLARRGTAILAGELLKHAESEIMDACLDNPRLRELSLIQFLGSAYATADKISRIARNPRWKMNANVRLAVLKNPQTPEVWFLQFLPQLPVKEVRTLLHSTRLRPNQRQIIADFLQRMSAAKR